MAWEARSRVGTILGVEYPGPLQYLKIAPRFSADARSPGTEMVTWTVHFLLIPACLLEDCAAERPFPLLEGSLMSPWLVRSEGVWCWC